MMFKSVMLPIMLFESELGHTRSILINESNKILGFLGIFEQTETLRSYELSTICTSSEKKIKRGAEFLPDVSLEDLKAGNIASKREFHA